MVDEIDLLEAYDYYKEDWESLDELREKFEWVIPEQFNVATHICDRWAEEEQGVAVYYEDHTTDETGEYTFREVQELANQLANHLESLGIDRGDRVGLNIPRKRETLISYVAVWKAGAVPVPLSTLFGPEGLEHRLDDSSAKAAIVDADNIEPYREVKPDLEALEHTLTVGNVETESDEADFWSSIEQESTDYETVTTTPEDDMLLMYTSGTTGAPKGVLHAHRSVIGHMPGVITSFYNLDVEGREVAWSPTEYSWAGTISFILSAWLLGNPIVTYESGRAFEPEEGFELIEKYDVTLGLIPPSGLRMMMRVDDPDEKYDLASMRHISSGGEALGSIPDWAEDVFGATVHEVYGQSEIWNMIIGDCVALEDFKSGWMGFPLPGHEATVLDLETREVLSPGEVGELAIKRDDPTVLKEYWNLPEKTENKFHDEWTLTEDLVERDEEGRFRFVGRTDDVIISSGYRIGPEEVEDSIAGHEAVVDAGLIGVPDEERGTVPKAFIVLEEGYEPSPELKVEIQDYVKDRLAAYEYPRHIEFVEELPRTTTGKIQRSQLREREGLDA